jgi:hypothetical protein
MASVLRGRLIALIEPLLTGLGYELVELEYVPGRGNALLRIYLDRPAAANDEAGDSNKADESNGTTVAVDPDGRIVAGEDRKRDG